MVSAGGAANPAAIATLMNGAVQGVATSTASRPVKKLPRCPPRAASALPVPAMPAPTSNTPDRFSPDPEQQPGHGRHEHRRGELEPPAGRRPGRPRRQQHAGKRGEGRQHAGGVEQGMGPCLAARGALGERHSLHCQHRKHAGHQVQDQPAQEGEDQHAAQWREGWRRRAGRQWRAARRRSPGQCGRAPKACLTDRHPASHSFGSFSDSTNPPRRTDSGCAASSSIMPSRSGMNQASVTVAGLQFRALHPQRCHPARSAPARARAGAPRGHAAANSGAWAEGAGVPGRRSRRKFASSGTQICLQTSQRACALDRDRTRGGGWRNGHRQQHVAGIGVGHHWPLGDAARRGPCDRAGHGACRQGQIERGRDPGVSRVVPVGVPAGRQAKTQADAERLAGGDGVGIGYQGDRVAAAAGRHALHCGNGAGRQQEAEQDKRKQASHRFSGSALLLSGRRCALCQISG